MFGLPSPTKGSLQFPACSQSSSAQEVLRSKNNQAQVSVLPRGSPVSSLKHPSGRRWPGALRPHSCNIQNTFPTSMVRDTIFTKTKPHDFLRKVPRKHRSEKSKSFHLEGANILKCKVHMQLLVHGFLPELHQEGLETCPTSEEMEPGCGPSFSSPKYRPPSRSTRHPELQGKVSVGAMGRMG